MARAVANPLLPAARPASTIARPRPRELPVTNHTCAIHPPLSSPPDILEKLLKLRIGCAMGIRKGLLVTEEIAESSDLRARRRTAISRIWGTDFIRSSSTPEQPTRPISKARA